MLLHWNGRKARRPRRGSIVALVMIGLLVTSLLGLGLVQMLLVHHRQMETMGRRQQCFWLAEAGVQKAQRQLAEDPDYQGEKWTIPADVLDAARPALVTIAVDKDPDSSAAGTIRVEARFPDEGIRRAVCRREFALTHE